MEKELKEILDKKLIGNDTNISDIILSYLKEPCFVCWKKYLEADLHKTYCDVKQHRQLYMKICDNCINHFHFKKCLQCKIWVDKTKCYIVDCLDDLYSCSYCCFGGLTEYTGFF